MAPGFREIKSFYRFFPLIATHTCSHWKFYLLHVDENMITIKRKECDAVSLNSTKRSLVLMSQIIFSLGESTKKFVLFVKFPIIYIVSYYFKNISMWRLVSLFVLCLSGLYNLDIDFFCFCFSILVILHFRQQSVSLTTLRFHEVPQFVLIP